MRVIIGFFVVIILALASCIPTTVELDPTATAYTPASLDTPIPLVYEPITTENAHSLSLLASWQIDTRAESLIFSSNHEILCAGKENVEHSWDLYSVNNLSFTTDCQMPFPNNNFGKKTITSDNHYSADIESGSGILYIIDLLEPTSYLYYYLDDPVSVSFSSSGQYLAIAFQNGDVWFVQKSEWLDSSNYLDLKPELTINTGKTPLQLLFSGNDNLLAILSQDQTIQIWNISDLSVLSTIHVITPSTPQTSQEASSGNSTNEPSDEGSQGRAYRMAFSSNGAILATASTDNNIHLWDIQTGKILVKLKGHQDNVPVTSLVFSPTNRVLASLYNGYFIYVWGILPDNFELAKVNSTAIANSIPNSIVLLNPFPRPTATPTSSLPTYQSQIPQDWPVEIPSSQQILEARECAVETLAQSRYTEEMLYGDFEYAYALESPCDWAVLAFAYRSRFAERESNPEEGKRAFFVAIQQNPALALVEPLLYTYFDNFELVDPPPATKQPIKSIAIDYEWSGIGDPANIQYHIEIDNANSDQIKMNIETNPEIPTNEMAGAVISEKVQELGKALTDFLPVQVPFTMQTCYDNYPNWSTTLTFQDSTELKLYTYGSNFLTPGGPWFMELDSQNYIQYSSAFVGAMLSLFESLELPLGQPHAMYCSHTDTIELAFP